MKLYKFFSDVKQEVQKVTWPTKNELFLSVAIVLVSVIVVSILILCTDYLVHYFVKFLLSIGN